MTFASASKRKLVMLFNAGVVEWYTRQSQKLVGSHPCGFDSHLQHFPKKVRPPKY